MRDQVNSDINASEIEQKIVSLFYKPTPSDRELEWNKSKVMLSKTDSKGAFLYINEAFIDVCGYDDYELISKSHNILRHPDMPKVIFKLLWENLAQEKSYHVIIKNMSKTGRYYWVANDIRTNKDHNGIISYTGQQTAVSDQIIEKHIEPLYKKLWQIEKVSGAQASENYLIGFLEEQNKTYVEYIDSLVFNISDDSESRKTIKKKGFFSGMFADDKKEPKEVKGKNKK
jgi:PAS domain S-box-containing protein